MIPIDEIEARVLGSLVEKSLTTPELYPLTLNALLNACNQKTSREPVMSLGFPEAERALKSLVEKGLAARRHESGSRASKYGHRIEILLSSEDPKTVALVCVLLLRGPQTLGELKTRTERLCPFADLAEVERLLQELSARIDGAIVARLPRAPGQKEARYRQLFTPGPAATAPAPAVSAPPAPSAQGAQVPAAKDRLGEIERRLAVLEAQVKALSDR